MTPVRTESWVELAARLADTVAQRGALTDPAWRAALTSVPRHELVPRYFVQGPDGSWSTVTSADDDYLEEVYSNRPLVTALTDEEHPQAASSSSQPSLMVRMLEALELRDGDRVLEIGTGTGYNAGLLSHRLGDDRVFSVDIDEQLVEDARRRLDQLGWRPHLAAVDGARGWPDHGPYDKVIATCSVPSVPREWAAQVADGGRILVDLKVGAGAGNLVLLRRDGDRLEGRFVPGWAGFMTIQSPDYPAPARFTGRNSDGAPVERPTQVGPQPWANLVPWFLAAFDQPRGLGYGVTFDQDIGRPNGSFLNASDGSWCEVREEQIDGQYVVRESGPTPLWAPVEAAIQLWREVGEPDWDRFGLTVTDDQQVVWLDDPSGPHRWRVGG